MNSDSYIDPDFPTKQSAGYMFVRLFFVQVLFMVVYSLLLFLGDQDTIGLPVFRLSVFDIDLILLGVVANFALFLIVFAVWQAVEFRITPKQLHIDRGFLFYKEQHEIELTDVERSLVQTSWLGRVFNYGTVVVYLREGSSRRILLRGVPFPYQFQSLLNAEILITHKYKKS